MPQISTETLEREVKEAISKIMEVDAGKIGANARLTEDLGADSMMALELMVALDKKYEIDIAETDLPKMTTVTEIVKIITKLINHA